MTTIRFSSWAQTAVGRAVVTEDAPGGLPAAGFTPGIDVIAPDGTATTLRIPAPMSMLGPESVAGLDGRAVVRTDPPAGAADVEDNYLVSVDLRPVELPWMFTPAKPRDGRLRPWIVLVVVETVSSTLVTGDPVPTLSVDVGQLPDLADSWGWAHVQRADDPAEQVARLLCPRRLRESTRYRACIVPAFGYLPAMRSYSPAWLADQITPVNLPVYYSWEFGTGLSGDFEHLVRRLGPAPKERTATLGTVSVDVHRPWVSDAPLAGAPQPAPYPVPGALGQLDLDGPPASVLDQSVTADFTTRITAQCNAAAGLLDEQQGDAPVAVAPPIYGGRHVLAEEIGPAAPGAEWLSTLNTAIPTRIAAGLGAEYVRLNQESLMARAWEQAGAIREANRRRALGQLVEGVTTALHDKHIANLALGEAMSVAAPAASRVRPWGAPGPPLATAIEVSVMPTGAASTAFARIMRAGGTIARATSTRSVSIIERAISGAVPVPAMRPTPPFTVSETRAETAPVTKAALIAQHAVIAATELRRLQAISDVARLSGLAAEADTLTSTLAGAGIDAAVIRRRGGVTLRTMIAPHLNEVTAGMAGAKVHLTRTNRVGAAVTDIGVQLDVDALRDTLLTALTPGDRIARAVAARISLPERMGPAVSLSPVLDHPTFPAPMALALRDFAPDWFLPGIADFPAESVTLLGVNNAFIESFMVGLAHEFNRELLWREYPTDMRGTAFRRFWPTPGDGADIAGIHEWTGPLGSHLTVGQDTIAVLLVRGTVVRRFPAMVVAAAPALSGVAGDQPVANDDTSSWRAPLFALPIDEQTMAYAFQIPPAELRALPTPAQAGWFFAFQENSTRMRFGFDLGDGAGADPPYTTWDDLTWTRVLTAHPDGARMFARADAALAAPEQPGDRQWNRDSTDIARIALQKPFRMLIHASELVGR
ncbi:hypothetical protein E4P42_01350 [Mycobacterium sp. PS03-16]|uniref:hypothetical protein n=1 Tax=Mycobacterium sp. PS03-16 TaxID=2559611 RepID=UPI00107327CB|nr:hypothetical protein [Mycobacterium sp. PS03-16]TFV61567.1 hypothetical protein E4P42_01350 [Mycobacterium sp. PS03-16]